MGYKSSSLGYVLGSKGNQSGARSHVPPFLKGNVAVPIPIYGPEKGVESSHRYRYASSSTRLVEFLLLELSIAGSVDRSKYVQQRPLGVVDECVEF